MSKEAFIMRVKGTSNGTTSYEKNGHWYHSVIVTIPGEESNLKISLKSDSNPQTFAPDTAVEMNVKPRFYNGRFSGLSEA